MVRTTETSTEKAAERSADCLFCKIVAGEISADMVAESESAVAFKDINPKAPVHVLVVPRKHHADVSALAGASPEALADVVALADQVASDLADGQYRLICNVGPKAGQTVFHAHAHVLAGTQLTGF
ncbi:histidine triad nucleotide-binding protein [Myceligenerans pegani]|uniref:Histidine triad nucleotide-binding protein n=1 Tax=Myceligenerans pegani TaxID=2776917 RepID=A0ABR9N2B0_9MICO|nr:histidine triad nucleotide-binding protein [Myceligenerans sp. TRM 65318]MBE1877785.1 histidine triad nucleotide-binding protein [Myceligenerans sp. TRM 65318]MBE3020056.1 histidine triad nucleotide-binding protein [Myceligenerans sp. TRM 65318]